MDALDNPFRPGAGAPPPALVGRDELVEKFRLTVGRAVRKRPGKSVMPIGLRGVGKTVLLNTFIDVAEQEGLKVGYIEAPETGDLRRLLAVRLRKILLDLDRAGKASRAVRRALGALGSFTYSLPDGTSIALNIDALAGVADSGDLSDDLTDLLVEAGRAAEDRETGIVLAIDEVQYLGSDELAALISAIHRTVQLNLPVVLVGAGCRSCPDSPVTRSLTLNASSSSPESTRWMTPKPATCCGSQPMIRGSHSRTTRLMSYSLPRMGIPTSSRSGDMRCGTWPQPHRSHCTTLVTQHLSSGPSSTTTSSRSAWTDSHPRSAPISTRWLNSVPVLTVPATSRLG